MKQSKTMELKKPVRVSLARQVLTAMESMIRSGKWKVGDRIPAEAELARAFSVSHNTIREALQSLIHMGMLEARPGDGTYVMASDRFAVAVRFWRPGWLWKRKLRGWPPLKGRMKI